MDLSFIPTKRIARASACNQSINGMGVMLPTSYPSSNVGSGDDYTIDFSQLVGTDDRVVYALFKVSSGATISCGSIFGNYATAWISWQTTGWKKLSVSVRTQGGDYYNSSAGININCASLITATTPTYAPNAYVINGDVVVYDTDGNPMILG